MKRIVFFFSLGFLIIIIASFIIVSLIFNIPIYKVFGFRILAPPLNTIVFVDGEPNPGAKVFNMKTTYDDQKPIDCLILYIPNEANPLGRDIIIIDRNNRKIGLPNASKRNYSLLFNYFLMQGGGSDWFVPFDLNDGGVKGWNFDPDLKINENRIYFKVPPELIDIGKEVLIDFI